VEGSPSFLRDDLEAQERVDATQTMPRRKKMVLFENILPNPFQKKNPVSILWVERLGFNHF
jgi:hypothetical protein